MMLFFSGTEGDESMAASLARLSQPKIEIAPSLDEKGNFW
jgi:hypothetical protein